jgi:hypothetical protein
VKEEIKCDHTARMYVESSPRVNENDTHKARHHPAF